MMAMDQAAAPRVVRWLLTKAVNSWRQREVVAVLAVASALATKSEQRSVSSDDYRF